MPAVFCEQKCDLILRPGKGERDTACCDLAGGEQKADALYGETVVFFALLPAQMCGNARTQFNDGEGLFDIVVRTDGKTVVDVLLHGLCGQEQNRAVRVVADGAAEFVAVRLRHHDVEKDEIILCEVRRKIRRYMRHAGNGMPLPAECMFNQREDAGIIVNCENVSHKNLISIKNPFHKGSGTKGTKVRTARKCASDKTSRTAFWSRVHGFHCNIT